MGYMLFTSRRQFMRSAIQKLGVLTTATVLVALFAVTTAMGAGKSQTYTGKVSDAMCGAKHMMAGDSAGCLKACVKQGSKYALVVGEKVYTLDSSDKATLDKLASLADKNAKVSGTANGDTIAVSSVAAAE